MNSKEELSKEKAEKSYLHHRDFEKHLDEKSGGGKNDRHPGSGHPINEGPKKGGGGKGNWGSIQGEIEDAKQEGLIE